ncbi:hypothetical protein FZ983_30385 [Azospirillum sp. B21]|uniref:hypothetical protein n=1 Tax=Azospirillum sp. B21 TaxID=2607496 RepID=UPI0011ED9591|nr:hypothetical protein [Azospirillum sp. B21]KAA0573324.1 hypothetical protein FZ983_30385 [Azospirillum sp. B21]
MTITETGAQWHEARATFIERIDALDAHGEAVGHTVKLTDDRYGLSSGWRGVALEIERNANDETLTMKVMG